MRGYAMISLRDFAKKERVTTRAEIIINEYEGKNGN
jgi:hypothetical protein